jgi:hypothetical protein
VAKITMAIKEVIIIIKRIKVIEVFKEEDIKDINLRVKLVYIN